MAARNKEMTTEVLCSISDVFPNLLSIPIPEDVNEVVVGLPSAAAAAMNMTRSQAELGRTPISLTESGLTSNLEVKDTLASLAATVAKSSGSSVNAEDLQKSWMSLLASAKFTY